MPPRELPEDLAAYLEAFERHMRCTDGHEEELAEAKRRTDAALALLGAKSRSLPTREWLDEVAAAVKVSDIAPIRFRKP